MMSMSSTLAPLILPTRLTCADYMTPDLELSNIDFAFHPSYFNLRLHNRIHRLDHTSFSHHTGVLFIYSCYWFLLCLLMRLAYSVPQRHVDL